VPSPETRVRRGAWRGVPSPSRASKRSSRAHVRTRVDVGVATGRVDCSLARANVRTRGMYRRPPRLSDPLLEKLVSPRGGLRARPRVWWALEVPTPCATTLRSRLRAALGAGAGPVARDVRAVYCKTSSAGGELRRASVPAASGGTSTTFQYARYADCSFSRILQSSSSARMSSSWSLRSEIVIWSWFFIKEWKQDRLSKVLLSGSDRSISNRRLDADRRGNGERPRHMRSVERRLISERTREAPHGQACERRPPSVAADVAAGGRAADQGSARARRLAAEDRGQPQPRRGAHCSERRAVARGDGPPDCAPDVVGARKATASPSDRRCATGPGGDPGRAHARTRARARDISGGEVKSAVRESGSCLSIAAVRRGQRRQG
jgi:hypothetical protein